MRWRLMAAFVGVTFVVLAAQDVPLAIFVRGVERDRAVASLQRDAFVLGGAAEDLLSGEADGADGADAGAELQSTVDLYAARDGTDVVIVDAAGVAVVASNGTARIGRDYSTVTEVTRALGGVPVSGESTSAELATEAVYVAVPVLSGTRVAGAVWLAQPSSSIDEEAGNTVRGIVVVALISLIGAGVAALFVSTTITRPLERLRDTTERIANGDLDTRAANDEGPPEVRHLAESFNLMTGQLSRLLDQQRSFAGDASHQLRTPLTALRLQLEQAAALVDQDPVGARARLEAADGEIERLQRLVQGLLMLARAEQSSVAPSTVDAGAVVAERCDMWASLAAERGIAVRCAAVSGTHVLAVPHALEQILDNLLDNAINIVPVGTEIDVALDVPATTDRTVGLRVLDRGPGMTADQLAHARDRFWRAPDSPYTGSGLGLAIVDQLARACGGSVELDDRPGGGLAVTVHLPAVTRR
ncbi:MAG: hypothetical protein RI958_128 [Actinomycetota bacterium]|jgi:signal transduction histidine kinase